MPQILSPLLVVNHQVKQLQGVAKYIYIYTYIYVLASNMYTNANGTIG